MHILLTNDDGPPSNQSSPYVHSLVDTLQKAGHTVSVVLPNVQRSWIGKAHMVGQTLTPSYFRPGTLHKDDGIIQDRPFNDGGDEWILLDGTPASCTQIGLWHLFNDRGPVDVIVSGPNYGRNTTAIFALSSGTLGAAMEGATVGKKSIAISYAFDSREHDPEIIAAASRVSAGLIEKFVKEWPEDVHVYSVNIPLRKGVEEQLITYANMIQNQWTSGSSFTVLTEGAEDADPNVEESEIRDNDESNEPKQRPTYRDHVTFKWAPNFMDVKNSSLAAGKGDGWHVLQGHVTVTPLKANFWHLPHYTGEIKLNRDTAATNGHAEAEMPLALVDYPEPYVQPLIAKALQFCGQLTFEVAQNKDNVQLAARPCVQFRAYEALDFDHALQHSTTSLICAYVIRKALIRKHYLSNTIASWLTKHPDSFLKEHFKASVHFELDYAEFLDDALVDAWDLHESMTRNEEKSVDAPKEWWILKPGMSDGGNGIRLFSSLEELQSIFKEWDLLSDDEDEENTSDAGEETRRQNDEQEAIMTSQLRHFIVQPYIDPPLLLPSYGKRKFHIRTYVLAAGAIKVFVYKEMLALFAAKPYDAPTKDDTGAPLDLSPHLTNTCFQDESTKNDSVHSFWSLKESSLETDWQDRIFSQICRTTGQTFEAAAKEQMVHFQTLPNAFEIFGVDFLVDDSLNVWLLEMNAYPDFKQTGKILQNQVVGGLFEEVINCAVAPFFGATQHAKGSENMVLVKDIDLGRQ